MCGESVRDGLLVQSEADPKRQKGPKLPQVWLVYAYGKKPPYQLSICSGSHPDDMTGEEDEELVWLRLHSKAK